MKIANSKKKEAGGDEKLLIFFTWPKTGIPRRAIVCSDSHPTEHISEFLDFHLKPLISQ